MRCLSIIALCMLPLSFRARSSQVERLIRRADSDLDGKLNLSEFVHVVKAAELEQAGTQAGIQAGAGPQAVLGGVFGGGGVIDGGMGGGMSGGMGGGMDGGYGGYETASPQQQQPWGQPQY